MGLRWRVFVLAVLGVVATGCSSSGGGSATSPVTSSPAPAPPASSVPSADPSAAAVQQYLDSVNALCDALLVKVIAVTNGGSFDIPRKDFFEQLPAHSKLRADFDRALAKIPVPPAAKDKAAALAAYIRFANTLDAHRLAAARRGDAAYRQEIGAEAGAGDDPSIVARNAAGFNESCDAR